MRRLTDCIADRAELAIPQPTEWQRVGNQIDAAFSFAGADFVNAHGMPNRRRKRPRRLQQLLTNYPNRPTARAGAAVRCTA